MPIKVNTTRRPPRATALSISAGSWRGWVRLLQFAFATTAPRLAGPPARTIVGLTYAPRRPSWWPVVAIVVAVTAARLIYLALLCPYTLVEDEAWYWEWSRHLEWSYYSKGPGIAWLIAASVAFFKQFGMQVNEFVVRFPAAIAGAVLMFAVAGLTRDVMYHAGESARPVAGSSDTRQFTSTTRGHVPLIAVIATLLAPIFLISSLIMTIDIPYMACWALAAWAGWRALRGGSGWAWLGLGAAVGVGFLFKYTILLLLPGLLLFVLLARPYFRLSPRWPAWLIAGTVVVIFGLLPVVIWNAQHDWPTVGHLLGHLGVAGGDVQPTHGGGRGWSYNPVWTLEYIASQLGIIGPLIVLMAWGAVAAVRRRREGQHAIDRLYLLACAAPILAFYLLVTLMTEAQANWPVAGYITLFPLAAWVVAAARDRAAPLPGGRPARIIWNISIATGILIAMVAARVDLSAGSRPIKRVERVARNWGYVEPGRPLIPLGRLLGADVMAQDVDRLAVALANQSGLEPFIVAQHYGRASLLAFYMPGQPTVYCSSAYADGRRTQYDLWAHTDLDDMATLGGRPAVLVGGRAEVWERAFAHIHEYGPLDGETKADRLTFLGLNYRGFDKWRERAQEDPR